MNAKKCDRCGRYFPVNNSYSEMKIDVTQCRAKSDDNYLTLDCPVEFAFDICPKCMKELCDIVERGTQS